MEGANHLDHLQGWKEESAEASNRASPKCKERLQAGGSQLRGVRKPYRSCVLLLLSTVLHKSGSSIW